MSNESSKVAVIMSTYNGEKYIEQQIDSILNQINVEVLLCVRDDGSKDHTIDIITKYTERYNNVLFWNKDRIVNLGVRDSFLTLLKEVFEKYQNIPYFAFADQDDVWKPEKLSVAVDQLKESANKFEEKPALYYSNKTFVDAELKLIHDEHIKFYGDFFEALWPSLASGCTMVFNRVMTEMAVRHLPVQFQSIHDAWIYRLAKCCDAIIVFDERSFIYYRQHGDNVFGTGSLRLLGKDTILNAFKRERLIYSAQIAYISSLDKEFVGKESKKYIEMCVHYNEKINCAIRMIFSNLALKRGPILYLTWIAKIILKKV